jgi:hypothetical protein
MTYPAMLEAYYSFTDEFIDETTDINLRLALVEERQRLLTNLVAAGIVDNS